MNSSAISFRAANILDYLLRENAAYAADLTKTFPDLSQSRYHLATAGQAPIAAVIACADSRVSPEILFRATLGQLFVIRTAGNTVNDCSVLGSLEYAIDHLKVPLVIILGHTCCGAVHAACSGGDPLPGALGLLVNQISKGIQSQGGIPKNNLNLAVQRNVRNCIAQLRLASGACISAAEKRGVLVRGAVYDIMSGKVSVVDT